MENFTVEYYETEDGTRPAEEFILSQDKKMQAKTFIDQRTKSAGTVFKAFG